MNPDTGSLTTGGALFAIGPPVSLGSTSSVAIPINRDAVSCPGQLAHGIPQMIPEDELLLWTTQWRALVAEARDEVARGESVEFTNFRDLARWLLSEDD